MGLPESFIAAIRVTFMSASLQFLRARYAVFALLISELCAYLSLTRNPSGIPQKGPATTKGKSYAHVLRHYRRWVHCRDRIRCFHRDRRHHHRRFDGPLSPRLKSIEIEGSPRGGPFLFGASARRERFSRFAEGLPKVYFFRLGG